MMGTLPGMVQPGTVAEIECPRCHTRERVPSGYFLRLPNADRRLPWCHELSDSATGVTLKKGGEV